MGSNPVPGYDRRKALVTRDYETDVRLESGINAKKLSKNYTPKKFCDFCQNMILPGMDSEKVRVSTVGNEGVFWRKGECCKDFF